MISSRGNAKHVLPPVCIEHAIEGASLEDSARTVDGAQCGKTVERDLIWANPDSIAVLLMQDLHEGGPGAAVVFVRETPFCQSKEFRAWDGAERRADEGCVYFGDDVEGDNSPESLDHGAIHDHHLVGVYSWTSGARQGIISPSRLPAALGRPAQ